MASGLSLPNIPDQFKDVDGYESSPLKPSDYEGKTVLILGMLKLKLLKLRIFCILHFTIKGRGNSAFETAQSIYGYTNLVHMVARSRVRNAFSTHYVGDVR